MTSSRLDALLEHYPEPNWRLAAWPVMFMLALLLIWSNFMAIKEVTVVVGVVVPPVGVKTIQHLEGGVVEGIHVSDGQVVAMDTPLILLNLAKNDVSREELQVRLDGQLLLKARFGAEAQGSSNFEFPEEVAKRRPMQVIAQRQNFEARRRQLDLSTNSFAQTVNQRRQEVKELEAQLRAVMNNLRLGIKRFEMSKNLLKDGLTPEMEHLQLEAEVQGLQGEAQSLKSSVPRAKAAVSKAEGEVNVERNRYRSAARKELVKVEHTIDSIQALMTSAGEQGMRTMIRSPIDGVVQKMNYNTIGGIIRPGEPIMEIVPTGASLVIDAKLNPADRAFVVQKQPVVVKLSSYDYTHFGGLDGHVTMVAPNTSFDKKGEPYFRVLVQTDKNYLGNDPDLYKITPGMQATVDIHTGEKSVMEYLIMPVLKLKHEAFRER
jgi:adhesin transport system membrane fusion protein